MSDPRFPQHPEEVAVDRRLAVAGDYLDRELSIYRQDAADHGVIAASEILVDRVATLYGPKSAPLLLVALIHRMDGTS